MIKEYPEEYRTYSTYYLKAEQATDADSILKYSEKAIEIAKKIGINPGRALILKGNGYHLTGKLIRRTII